jgi:hypothetical protein
MSAPAKSARKWTCEGCGVSASRIDGTPTPFPEAWASSVEGDFCLACRRQRAAEAALEAAPEGSDRDARAKLRRAGLIEFEVRRAPDRTDGSIAKACRSSAAAVAAARRRMHLRQGPRPSANHNRASARGRLAGRT